MWDEELDNSNDDQYPFWRMDFPVSGNRAAVDALTGFNRMMPLSDMSRASDVELGYVCQDMPWFLQDWLYRLGR